MLKSFVKKGYLQELNRRFLHPLGLALEISIDNNNNEMLSGIWDYRDNNEGIYYDINNSDDKRKNRFKNNKSFINNELKVRSKNRKELLGFDIEPIE